MRSLSSNVGTVGINALHHVRQDQLGFLARLIRFEHFRRAKSNAFAPTALDDIGYGAARLHAQ